MKIKYKHVRTRFIISGNEVCRRNSTDLNCAKVHVGHNLFELGLSQYNSTENESP